LHATLGSKGRDAAERHYQMSRTELERIIPSRLISIDITLAQARFFAEKGLQTYLENGM
jgi:hypothetical protein